MMTDAPETDLDWENRRLCSDDSCIGVIGSDGRCRVCGVLDTKSPVDSDRSSDDSAVIEKTQGEPYAEDQAPESDTVWEDRKLCRDESCIGTIGADGRCTVCGLTG